MNKKRKVWPWILIGCLVLAGIAAAIIIGISAGRNHHGPTDASTEATEDVVPTEAGEIYYNIDRLKYLDQSASGLSGRKRDEDGTWHIRFFVNGKETELKAATNQLINEIDAKDVMGLITDEEGNILEVVDLDDMKVKKAAWRFFVKSVGKKKVTFNSSMTFEGESAEYRLSDDCKIYDMSGESEPGTEADLHSKDRIYAFENEDGELYLIYIFERGKEAVIRKQYCRYHNQDEDWLEWDSASTLPTEAGHYILTGNVKLKDQQTILNSNTEICLDLNGFTVTGAEDYRVYALFEHGDVLSIFDSSEEQNGRIQAIGESPNEGGVVWVRYADDVLNLYEGILDGSGYTLVTAEVSSQGEIFFVHKHGATVNTAGVFNMYGGTVIGGTAWKSDNAPWEYAGNGGAIAVLPPSNNMENGVFNMYGGEVYGGTANAGGNIILYGEMNMSGGRIYGGVTKDENGNPDPGKAWNNIFIVDGFLNMSGGEIAGYVELYDNLKDNGRVTSVSLTGSPVIYGAAPGGSNLYIFQDAGDGAVLHVDSLTDGAKISVTASGLFTTPTDKANLKYFLSDIPNVAINHTPEGLSMGGRYACICGSTGAHFGACDGTKYEWLPWTETTYLPAESGKYYLTKDVSTTFQQGILKKDGQAQDVYLDLNGHTVTAAPNIRIYALFDPDCSLTITDSSPMKTGKMVVNGSASDIGLVVWVRYASNTFNLYNGTLDAANATLVTAKVGDNYIVVSGAAVNTAGTFNMYGGKIVGGTAYRNGDCPADMASNGGAVSVMPKSGNENGIFRMYGGEILGGKANAGGNVILYGEMEMAGGRISGGKGIDGSGNLSDGQNGPNIFEVMGTLRMSGGSVDGGVMTYGASNITVSGNAKIIGGADYDLRLSDETQITVNGALNVGETPNIGVSAALNRVFAVGSGVELNDENKAFFGSGVEGAEVSLKDGGLALTLAATDVAGCECGDQAEGIGDHVHNELTWVEVPANDALDPSFFAGGGAFKLLGDVTVTEQIIISGEAAELHFDLNGFTLTKAGGGRVINGWAASSLTSLTITDSSEAGNGRVLATGSYDIEGGCVAISNNTQFKLYRGVLDASPYTQSSSWAGGSAVFMTGSTKFTMYGGAILGGTCVNQNGSAVDVYGSDSVMTMYGGKISGGTGASGGNVRVMGTMFFHDGEITGGKAPSGSGGNLILTGTLNMDGGKITGGTAAYGNNIFSYGGTLNITGGEIEGGVLCESMTTLNLAGAPKILGGADYNVKLGDEANIVVTGALTVGETPNVGVTATVGRVFATGSVSDTNKAFFKSDIEGTTIALQDGGLAIVAGIDAGACECGGKADGIGDHEHNELTWTEVPANTALDPGFFANGGAFRLTGDVSVTDQISISGTATELHLDLNGHTLTRAGGGRVFSAWGASSLTSFTITDSSEAGTGKITATGTWDTEGGCIALSNNVHLKMYAGTIDASGYTLNSSWAGGSAVFMFGTSKLTMYGGEIIGGSSAQNGGTIDEQSGDAVITMYGGKISGGTAASGGNIRIIGTIVMHNGEIAGGKAPSGSGGNLIITGTFTMYGGKIAGGTAAYGNNLFTYGSTVNLIGGTIEGSVLAESTTTINITGSPKVLGGTDYNVKLGDEAKIVVVGALMVGETPNVGVTATQDRVFASGSGIVLNDTNKAFFVSDVTGLTVTVVSGGLALTNPPDHSDCECGNKADSTGGHTHTSLTWTEVPANTALDPGFFANGGAFRLTGDVSVTDQISISGTATELHLDLNGHTLTRAGGGRVFSAWGASSLTSFTITDSSEAGTGKITATGTWDTEGGCIALSNNVHLKLYAGTIDASGYTLNSSWAGGSAVFMFGTSKLTMYGGEIIGGSSAQNGGTIDEQSGDAVITMYGGKISGGTAGAGGNIRVLGTMTMNGGEIYGGHATVTGGNMIMQGVFTMNGGKIYGGIGDGSAPNIYTYGGTMNLNGGEIDGGILYDGGTVVNTP